MANNETYKDYPAAAKKNAKMALDWRDKYGREEVDAGTAVGWQRANQLAKGEAVSADVVSRMAQFNRHRKNSKIAPEFKDTPWKDRGYVAWLIWGGDEGVDWAIAKMDEIQNEAYNINKYSPVSYAKQVASGAMTMQDAMEETGISFTALIKLVKKINKNFKIRFESMDMKHFKTFEAYVSYDNMSKGWGNPSEIENDIRQQIVNMFVYGEISDNLDDVIYTDQSTDKGIKWQIEVKGKGSDMIHVYKDGKWRGEYEWYLNKKKSTKYDIQQYFLEKYISVLEQYLAAMKSFDFYYNMSDDSRAYKAGSQQSNNLKMLYNKLSNSDKKKAHAEFIKKFKVDREFKNFNGV